MGTGDAMPEKRSVLSCTNCGREIECCEFCDESDCGAAMCYGCVHRALGQQIAQPHGHGG